MTKIPSDMELIAAGSKFHALDCPQAIRAMATLAAEQAVKAEREAIRQMIFNEDGWKPVYVPDQLRPTQVSHVNLDATLDAICRAIVARDYNESAPTPPKEQPVQPISEKVKQAQMAAQLEAGRGKRCGDDGPPLVPTKPSPDPATVRLCIEALREVKGDGSYLPGAERAAALLESLLPTPAPEPERYVTLDEMATILFEECGVSPGVCERAVERLRPLAAKHTLLTPEQAMSAYDQWMRLPPSECGPFLAALRLAAKQGGGA